MKKNEMMKLVVDKVKSNKKTSRVYEGFEKDMAYLFAMIERFNAMPRNAMNLDGVPVNKIPFIEDLKDLVYPNSVTVSGKNYEEDYLIRGSVEETFPLDVDRMSNIVAAFYGMFKKEAKEVTLADIRKDEALSVEEFAKSCSVEGMCASDLPVRLPVPISIKVYRGNKYFFEEDEVVREVLDKKIRELAK